MSDLRWSSRWGMPEPRAQASWFFGMLAAISAYWGTLRTYVAGVVYGQMGASRRD